MEMADSWAAWGGADPADDDDAQRHPEDLESGPGVDAEEGPADDAAGSGQEGAEREHGGGQEADVDARAARHLGVVHAGADHGAQARALLEPPEPEADDQPHGDDEEAIAREDDRADPDRSLEDLGLRQRLRRAAP